MNDIKSNEPDGLRESRRILPAMLLLFIGSGCAALIYEIVWLQLLQLVIGLTTVSLGVLLGAYMGGMCLGSYLLPRLVSARRHPLRVYALLELGIGVIGIAILFGMPWVAQIYTAVGGSGFGGIVVRCLVAGVCLVPPTLLMGATLPAMSRWVETTPQGISWLGFFYGGNIAGAVFGCLFAGFYLLRIHDMAFATCVAASINAAVALLALGLAALTSFKPAAEVIVTHGATSALAKAMADKESRPAGAAMKGFGAVYLAIALSGLAALGAEVVWTRLLALMLGATVYTFSIILAVFLAGLGLGSSLGSVVARLTARPRLAFGVCQLLLAGAVAWTAWMITGSLPNWPINPQMPGTGPWYIFQLDIARCLWAILPAPLLWGASFPLALASVSSRGQDSGRLVGGVYAANTVGAILGALGFSLLLIPLAGTQAAQRVLILLSAVSGLVVLAPLLWRKTAPAGPAQEAPLGAAGAVGMCGALGLAVLLAWHVGVLPWGVVAYGRFVATYGGQLAPGIIEEDKVPQGDSGFNTYCEYVGEGLNGTVAVTMRTTDKVRSFHSAGKVQASNDPRDMRLQRMLGHISALAFPNPTNVLVVACGAGVTAGSFIPHTNIQRIVICDIEPLVPDHVTPRFSKENYSVVDNKRVQMVHDDGRHYIRTTKEKFDVITSDPIDPWVKGCAALNTVEYYQMCKAHLNPGGVMSLWIPFYESNSETIKSVLATFFKVFPNGIVWSNDENGAGYDAVLFGQVEPTVIDVDQWQERLDRPENAAVRQSLEDVGFHNAVDLLATYAARAADLGDWMSNAQINTDRNLRLQYLAGLSLNNYQETKILNEITRTYQFPENLFVGAGARVRLLEERLKIRKPAAAP
ncbi:MAG: fused MFS/spermidine synthase [Verrucomicrobiota bacterium]